MTMIPPERPSLRGAKLRSERAAEHLQAIHRIEAKFKQDNPNPVVATIERAIIDEGRPLAVHADWSRTRHPPTKMIGILAGEALYNLRAALDYLVFGLAWLDCGSQQDDTQFPIVDNPRRWSRAVQRWMRGVSAEHIDRIVPYQPFSGCTWTRKLRDLSNPDKHRSLTAVEAHYGFGFRIDPERLTPVPDDPDRLFVPVFDQSAEIYFWTREDTVVATLRGLVAEVGRVLDKFQGDFGESDV